MTWQNGPEEEGQLDPWPQDTDRWGWIQGNMRPSLGMRQTRRRAACLTSCHGDRNVAQFRQWGLSWLLDSIGRDVRRCAGCRGGMVRSLADLPEPRTLPIWRVQGSVMAITLGARLADVNEWKRPRSPVLPQRLGRLRAVGSPLRAPSAREKPAGAGILMCARRAHGVWRGFRRVAVRSVLP